MVNAHTDYSPIHGSEPLQFAHPTYIFKLLQTIRKTSGHILSEYDMVKTHQGLPVNIPVGTSLLNLLNSARESDHAWPVFKALWAELTDPSAPRPPVLMAVDGFAHLMKMSEYRAPNYDLIHAHDLALIGLFMDALSGKTKMPHGGGIIAATSGNNAPNAPSLDLALAQRYAEQKAVEVPAKDPYFRHYDARVEDVLKTVQVMKIGGLEKQDARSLLEYWAASGMWRSAVDEKNLASAWSLGGHGNVGEMERATLMTMRI